MKDNVNHPHHYTQGAIECIDAMKSCSSPEAFQGYLRLCAIKYIWRMEMKGDDPMEDLQKARWYLNKLIEEKKNG